MPTEYSYSEGPSQRERLDAWRAHYLAKGCSSTKAAECAYRKRWTHTWPPKQ